jgi:hypothetical protein
MDFVESVLGNHVRVVCEDATLREKVLALGAVVFTGALELKMSSKQELAVVIQQLQKLGLPFGDEPAGWPPAAVFIQLREEGIVSGTVKTVSWVGPNNPRYGQA